ncbi:MAG TPA: sugar transferase [Gemmatimonadales bacterium]|nr:sugar transferase [Gemmatimonadales bacterium]
MPEPRAARPSYTFLEATPLLEASPTLEAGPTLEVGPEASADPPAPPLPFRVLPTLDQVAPGGMASGGGRAIPSVLYRCCDDAVVFIAIFAALVLTNSGRMPLGFDHFVTVRINPTNVLIALLVWVSSRIAFTTVGLYRQVPGGTPTSEAGRILLAAAVLSLVTLLFPLTDPKGAFGYDAVLALWALCTAGMILSRVGLRRLVALGRVRVRNTLVIGTGPRSVTVCGRVLADRSTPRCIVGFLDSEQGQVAADLPGKVIGVLGDLPSTLLQAPIDEVIVALPIKSRYKEIQEVIDVCEGMGVPVVLPADAFHTSGNPFRPRISGEQVIMSLGPHRRLLMVWLKRGIDIVGAVVALVLTAPIMLLAALAVALTSPGPVLFTQERYGYSRRRFRMYKFRTMVLDAESMMPGLERLNEAQGPLFKIGRDPRVTVVGRILRRTSIDELPQLINVLRGDMSLVGPRPLSLRDVYRLPEAELARRFSVPQGLTGMWQVQGRSQLDYRQWVSYDLKYVDHWSLLLDLRILLRTIPAVLRGDGAQ